MAVFITGDKHSHLKDYENAINQVPDAGPQDTMVVLGDAGFEYGGRHFFSKNKKKLARFPGTWLIMRGNHDDCYTRTHTRVEGDKIVAENGWSFSEEFEEPTLYQDKYPNIHYVSDSGGLYCLDGHWCLFCPGAYSVDKYYRERSSAPYNPNEQLTYGEWLNLYKLAEDNKDAIEYVFSHTYPIEIEKDIQYLFLEGVDESSIDKSTEIWLSQIYQVVKDGRRFKHWFFGHLHDDKDLDDDFTILFNKVVRMEDYGK